VEDFIEPAPWAAPTAQVKRSTQEEQFLTDFARTTLNGRRWMCHLVHICWTLGFVIGAIAAGWDHILAAAEHVLNLIARRG